MLKVITIFVFLNHGLRSLYTIFYLLTSSIYVSFSKIASRKFVVARNGAKFAWTLLKSPTGSKGLTYSAPPTYHETANETLIVICQTIRESDRQSHSHRCDILENWGESTSFIALSLIVIVIIKLYSQIDFRSSWFSTRPLPCVAVIREKLLIERRPYFAVAMDTNAKLKLPRRHASSATSEHFHFFLSPSLSLRHPFLPPAA